MAPAVSASHFRFVSNRNKTRMSVPTISTRTTNLELTKERKVLLMNQLRALQYCVSDSKALHIDIVMRRHQRSAFGQQYFLSVKVTSGGHSYITVAISGSFARAIAKAVRTLRKQLIEDGQRPSQVRPNSTLPVYA